MKLCGPDGVWRDALCSDSGALLITGGVGGGGTSDSTEATQLLVKAAVQSINTKTPTMVSCAMPVTPASRTSTGQQVINVTNTPGLLFVPGGSASCRIQADGGVIRVSHGAINPSETDGIKIQDGESYVVDTNLSALKLFAPVACKAQIVYFDRP